MNLLQNICPRQAIALGLTLLTLSLTTTNSQALERLRITGTGSGTGGMTMLAEAFMRTNPDVQVDVLPALGSSGGIRALVAHKIDLAISNREPRDKERARRPLRSFNYARTPVVIAVHKSLGVTSITSDQLAVLYGTGAPAYPNGHRARPVLRMSDATDTRIVRSISPAVAAAVDAVAACSMAPPIAIPLICWKAHPAHSDPAHWL